LTLSNGGSVALPTNNDNSPTNELQTLGLTGNTLTLTDGGSVSLPNDNDTSARNEIQTLTLSNDTIFLSDGGHVILPSQSTFTAGTGISISSGTISATNTSSIWNASQLQGVGVSSSKPAKDQILQYSGTSWTPVTLSGGGTSIWKKDSNNIYFENYNVGIGTDKPIFRLHITDSIYGTGNGTIMTQNYLHGGTDGGYVNYAFRSVVDGHGGGDNTAGLFYSINDVSSTGMARGVRSVADGDGRYNYGMHATSGENASVQNYGVVAVSDGEGTFNMGVFTIADGNSSNTNYGIYATVDSATTTYAGYFNGNVTYTGTLASASDIKFKRDIQNLTGALELITSLEPKTYYFKDEGDAEFIGLSSSKQYGFIAQDLQKVFPDLVHTQKQPKGLKSTETIEYVGVDYISLVPVLTQAIKEQQDMIEDLQAKLLELEQKINEMNNAH